MSLVSREVIRDVPNQAARRELFATDGYLKSNPIIPIRARLVGEVLADMTAARILDLGCGDGTVSLPLLARKNSLTLVDLSAEMLRHAMAAAPPEAPVEFVHADVLDYVAAVPYDAVLCIGVMAHVTSVAELVARVASATKPGGRCVIQITDDAQRLGRSLNRYVRGRHPEWGSMNEMTLAELTTLASHYDLEVLTVRRYGLELPGSGYLPYSWRCRLENLAATAPYSRVAGELVATFGKRPVVSVSRKGEAKQATASWARRNWFHACGANWPRRARGARRSVSSHTPEASRTG